MNPEISVVMSVYNAEKYIHASIESILNQSFSNFEFLIVNDGSTDLTFFEIKKFAEIDSRIKVINQENIGLTKSLIKAIKMSKGQYIARMDADDVSSINRFCLQLSYMKKNQNVGMLGSCVKIIDANGKKILNKKLPKSNKIIRKRLQYGNQFVHGSVMFTRDIYFAAGGYDENFRYSQDYDLWLRISKLSKCANFPKYLYYLRVHHHSISNKKSDAQLGFAVDAIMKNVSHIQIDNSSRFIGFRHIHKVFGMKEEIDISRIRNIVSARLLLRKGDYKSAMSFYAKLNTIEAILMLSILRYNGITLIAKRIYLLITRIIR